MIVFVSNYYNHHQEPFSKAMYRLTEGEYRFVACEPMEPERIEMGWHQPTAPFLMQYTESPTECQDLIDTADVVLCGSARRSCIEKRLYSTKLTLPYSERLFKRSPQIWKDPFRYFIWRKRNPQRRNNYLLCASAFTAADYGRYGLYRNACYKWGYFPETKRYASIDRLIERKKPGSMLWAARFIEWKHPELPVMVAKRLADEGYSFEMNLIGNGVLEEPIRSMILENHLEDKVHLLGAMSPEEVRTHMEQSQIFLFTSDRNEGWGAVLNESMNSGCAVVASSAIGSVPYLVEDGKNGLVYRDGDFESLYHSAKLLLDEPAQCSAFGKAAYENIVEQWNADVAAERLLHLIDELKKQKVCNLYPNGPCSKERP